MNTPDQIPIHHKTLKLLKGLAAQGITSVRITPEDIIIWPRERKEKAAYRCILDELDLADAIRRAKFRLCYHGLQCGFYDMTGDTITLENIREIQNQH